MILIAKLGGMLILHYVIIQNNLHNYYDILTMHFLNSFLIRILHANLYNHYDITIFYSLLLRFLHLHANLKNQYDLTYFYNFLNFLFYLLDMKTEHEQELSI